jgi:hypothetical protein
MKRLRAVECSFFYDKETAIGGETKRWRNPDGPKAADALEAKDREIAALREALWLARDYVDANGGGWCRDGVGDRLVLKHIDAALKEDKPLQPMETCPECRVYSEGGRAHRQVPPCSRLAASAPAKEQP